MATTKAPSGLSIARNKLVFTTKWKVGQKYSAQQFQWRVNSGKWTTVSVGATATSKNVTVNQANYNPTKSTKATSISFRVRGKSGGKWSSWTAKALTLAVPNRPYVGAVPDSTLSNVCVFDWNLTKSDTDTKHFANIQWESILVEESNITDGSKLVWDSSAAGWQTGTSTSNDSSNTITEDTSVIANGSHTRWYRIRSRGITGDSAWNYSKRVYASPFQAVITDYSVTRLSAGLTCWVEWEAQTDAAHPISQTVVEYVIATPATGMVVPQDAMWIEADTSKDTSDMDAVSFSIDSVPSADECLFVRVNTEYDNKTTYGIPQLVDYGTLSNPTGLSASTSSETHRATITAVNESDVVDSYLAVIYRSESESFVIGIIPHGSTSVTVQCPNWGTENVAFGVYAVVGEYSQTTRADGITSYEITEVMRSSSTLWDGGAVPLAPSNVTLQRTDIVGTIRVKWDWSWETANNAVISWADHADAWESTDEPSEYTVNNLHASQWNISGLETGKRWYIRVRLVKSEDGSETMSPWSDITYIDLSSAPSVPTLMLSSGVVTVDGSFNAMWSYVTTDGTAQAYAEIAEIVSNEYQPIAHVTNGQSMQLFAESLGWTAGAAHVLAVRVTSESGNTSEWSEAVSIIVAEPVSIEISDTSLETQTEEIEPREYSGELVTFEASDSDAVKTLSVTLEPQQDLNGYDKPWVGGAGKNLLPFPYLNLESTVNGITYKVNDDGSVDCSGTATSVSYLWLYGSSSGAIPSWIEAGKTYAASCGNGTPRNDFPRMQMILYGSPSIVIAEGSSTLPSNLSSYTGFAVVLQVFAGETIPSGTRVYPQIELDTTPTAYEPYSNICPISGTDEVRVYRTGKNLFGGLDFAQALVDYGYLTTLDTQAQTVTFSHAAYIDGTYTHTLFDKFHSQIATAIVTYSNSGNNNSLIFRYSDNDYSQIGLPSTNGEKATVVVQTRANKTVVSLQLSFYSDSQTVLYYNESGIFDGHITADQFEPYDGTTYTTDLGRTVYGGTLDVVSGVLTVTHKFFTENGTGNWIRNSDDSFYLWTAEASTAKQTNDGYCNYCKYAVTFDGVNAFVRPTNSTIALAKGWGDIYATADELKTAFASTPLQICYPLATPQTYQLTPSEVTLLVGENVLWSNGDSVDVKINMGERTSNVLTELPLTIQVDGAGTTGTTTVSIVRAQSYHLDRPNGDEFNGYDGETVALISQTGNAEVEIDRESLLGSLDDGAQYRIVASVSDEFGQSAQTSLDFEVGWEHQALMPEAEVEMEGNVAKIKPIAPTGTAEGDTCDIYRLSADKPELIVKGAEFGTWYVDPYPAIGEYGGHRVVFVTANGDYITADNEFAWIDLDAEDGDILETENSIVDFDGEQIELKYSVDLSNNWEKDFQETKYLGGSIQGDWIAGVRRTASASATTINMVDGETVSAIRRLANYSGVCHIRTIDGSSFPCDIQVSENRESDKYNEIASFSFSITRVDAQEPEGMTYEMWSS